MQPDISIILSAPSGRDALFFCLEALLNQTYPLGKTEVIVLDSAGMRLDEVLSKGEYVKFFRLKYIPSPAKKAAAVWNMGVKNSSAGILAFIDDECVVDCDWVKWIMEAHKTNPANAVIGGLTYVSESENVSLVGQFLRSNSRQADKDVRGVIFSLLCNVSFKKQVFLSCLFDERFELFPGEGMEFFLRLSERGYRGILDINIKLARYYAGGFISLLAEAYSCGRGDLLTEVKHKGGHPLLKGIKTGWFSFWAAWLPSLAGAPGYGFLMCSRLAKEENITSFPRIAVIYPLFVLYRLWYLWGALAEFCSSAIAGRLSIRKGE